MAVWLSDFDVARMTWRVPHPYSEDDAEAFLAREPDLTSRPSSSNARPMDCSWA